MTGPEQLSTEQLAALDATYKPIPAFAEWPRSLSRSELWRRSMSELAAVRESAPSDETMSAAVEIAMRAAAFDTGAIEGLYKTDRGLTMTVATQAATWQADVDAKQPDARAFFDAQLEAYELVLDVTTQRRPVTEVWIRHLHEILTRPQSAYTVQTVVGPQERPLPRGRYKSDPNHVRLADGSVHPYAPVESTSAEMGRLVREIGSERFLSAEPVIQAAYVHYCLVAIHPFADGNGRVARAVASVYLYRAASVPLLILADQRDSYFTALQAADRGDFGPFIDFVGDVSSSAIGMVVAAIRTALSPPLTDSIDRLRTLLSAQGGLTHHEIDAVGNRLQSEVAGWVSDALEQIALPPGVEKSRLSQSIGSESIPSGYRQIHDGRPAAIGVVFQSAPPAQARVSFVLGVAVSKADDDSDTFALFDLFLDGQPNTRETLAFTLHEVYPELTAAAQFRVRAYIDRTIGRALADLVEQAGAQLGRSGYGSA